MKYQHVLHMGINLPMDHPDKSYRRINNDLRHDHGIYVNDKPVRQIIGCKDIIRSL